MIQNTYFLIPALVAILTAIVIISKHARNRAIQYSIQQRNIDYMCRLAEKHGWGKTSKYYANRRGSDEVFVFGPWDTARDEDRKQAIRILPHHADDPIVFLYTVYRDETRYNPDGSKKEIGRDARRFQKFDDDY